MIEATGAQIVVKLLERQGVTTVAGIPGGSILPLYDEIARSGPLKHVLVRHEQGGGFLAQGMARSTGIPGVCLATSGPGAMNLLTAIADALSDSIPLVAITGQVNTFLIGTDAFQEVDTFGLSFPIAKHSMMVKSAAELLDALPRAFAIASSGRPGPVLVDIPRDVQLQKAKFEDWPEPGKRVKRAAQFKTAPSDYALILKKSADLLVSSVRPVLYAGGGCNSKEAAKGIARLREVMPLPVVTSLMGIGSVPAGTDDPQSFGALGMVGMHGSVAANRAMHEADLVLAVGVRFDDRATGLIKKFCPEAKIIHIDIDAAEVNKIIPSFLSIIGDAESALPALAEFVAAELRETAGRVGDRRRWMERLESLKAEETARNRERAPDHPGSFIASIPERAREVGFDPDKILVTTDVGQHQMWAAQNYPVKFPRQFMTSGSLGTMGFGLPVAIGAALANPEKRVVCFSGDGSIMMNIQELATLAEECLDVTVIVLDNGGLGMVRQQQTFLFGKNYSACDYAKSPDLLKIAEGFGIRAVDATEQGWEKSAFGAAGPCVVRMKISPSENVFPFVPAGKANIEAITGV
jgi:acetolactate synthase-1/2/3 large subunit